MGRRSWVWRAGLVSIALIISASGAPLQAALTEYSLLTAESSATVNGALFTPFNPDTATGTGLFKPFLRIQDNGVETGYNTDGDVEFQTKPGKWTHSLLLGDVPVVDQGGTLYREFLLDANQEGNDGRILSIDQLIISLQAAPDLTGYPAGFVGPVVYNLDGGGDSSVILDARLFNPGSGDGDVRLLILNSLFSGTDNPYVYLYSVMGEEEAANDGFEEWGTRVGEAIPAPGAVLLAAVGIGLVGWVRQRRVL